jgi:uncharacterized membrane protein YeaQ/YmgE (transglycosylase-associated protein family)
MSIIGWILFGLVVGIIGKLLTPGRDPGGFVLTILLGIAGALVGGFLGQSLGFINPTSLQVSSWQSLAQSFSCSFIGCSRGGGSNARVSLG